MGEGGADVGGEVLPARGPLDEQFGSVMELGGGFFELENCWHGENSTSGIKARNIYRYERRGRSRALSKVLF